MPYLMVLSVDGALYWRRACQKHFARSKCDALLHGGSWKVTFFELLLEEIIEHHVPEVFIEFTWYCLIANIDLKPIRIDRLPQDFGQFCPSIEY
jgi:hypothetical protein